MRVRILPNKYLAGPSGTGSPGQVLDLPDDEAQRYVDAGAAVSLEPARDDSNRDDIPAVVEPAVVEKATAEPDSENPEAEVLSRRRGRKRA